ncbi:hypothetical protein [Xanthocytophaga agilis]|uniref:Uncharacterized protein n=1 Tax=Xanthocytophaga agilis TaxID=3048010 RepID=A0AAE3R8X0_9BACT|nr:hypothetical protein [Xanthocytophaga agilis]MDJ1502927.1 hypothetical protein [Xanthocytophaga agilis]
MNIQYVKGDAAKPQTEGNKIIFHICNDIGGWRRGFVQYSQRDSLNLKNNTGSGIKEERNFH